MNKHNKYLSSYVNDSCTRKYSKKDVNQYHTLCLVILKQLKYIHLKVLCIVILWKTV